VMYNPASILHTIQRLFLPLSRGSQRGSEQGNIRLTRPPLTPPTQEWNAYRINMLLCL
jgi:hypothetical protein